MKDVDMHLTDGEIERIVKAGTRHVFRNTPMGRAWDTFHVDGKYYEIIDVSERSADTIARVYYRLENCSSPEDFIRVWKEGHSGRWEPKRMLYIHWFRDITRSPGNDLI